MLPTMKVIHAPLEIAGQVGLICEFLRKLGIHSVGYNYYQTYLDYRKIINTDSFELAKILDAAIQEYDLFHFHNSYTFLEDRRDIEMITDAGKNIIIHHRGNDVRSRALAFKGKGYVNPYVNAECSLPDDEIDRNLRYFAKHASAAIVQDYELYGYVIDYYAKEGKPVYVLPRLIDVSAVQPAFKGSSHEPPLVVHAPTQRDFKGTAWIEEAVSRLRKEMPIRFRLVEGMSHAEALQLYREADIVIDQVLCGAYGNLSVEAMALGKPVICYIREDLVSRYPLDLPVVSANPDNLYDMLKMLVKDKEMREVRARLGRAYVERHHSASVVIQSLVKIYEGVWRNGGK
ncbi:hypothetical protein ABEV74_18645 [Paenibacillus cisolokensis]|uniref:hypothetical protein n=1 Tax=Paenibacillus cisolokensis TaxID=1658519 RepID=UPI003D2D5709